MTKKKESIFPPLKGEAACLVNYWISLLQEGERASFVNDNQSEHSLECPLSDMARGLCSPHVVSTMCERAKLVNAGRRKAKKSDDDVPDELRVLISPIRFLRQRREDNLPRNSPARIVDILWVPAMLNGNGRLAPPPRGGPWIHREVLEPPLRPDAVTIGLLDDLEKFAERAISSWNNWDDYWKYSMSLLRFVSGKNADSIEIEGYRRLGDALLTLDSGSFGASSACIGVLKDVLNGKRAQGLLPRFTAIVAPPPRNYSNAKGTLARSARRHGAQFGNRFPLSASQRQALHRFIETPSKDFLCVTGPPGTGKTTLIQNVIATLWVEAIGLKNARPPVIVACAATNQAVMNIIDSLEKTVERSNVLAERWLPKIHSYGTFCVSATKFQNLKGYQVELRKGEGFSSEIERLEYLGDARELFLKKFADWSGRKVSLEKAVSILRGEVQKNRDELYQKISLASYGSLSEWLRSLVGAGRSITKDILFSRLSEWDTTLRHEAFLLGTHYWEGRWLQELGDELHKLHRRDDSERSFSGSREHWQRRAMLTPAFVSTLAMAPRFFAERSDPATPPIDLLIYDEAGQIPVEMGVACACLAKKALIVGDCAQLEPMWSVEPHLDRIHAETEGVIKARDPKAWENLVRRGLNGSSGSFMFAALRSTPWEEKSTRGVFLSEQRRSKPPLVQFGNALVYRDRLIAKRDAAPESFLPVFCYVHVRGRSRQIGQSRYNPQEVEQITFWIKTKEKELLKFYGARSISEVVAVITPFAEQSRRLEASLGKFFENITIGTVHSLQGSERPIVVFSSVYDSHQPSTYMLDRAPNLLNVAVSRAQDSFVVFGDMAIFSPEKNTPSGLLARFLYAEPESELVDVPPLKRAEVREQKISRLTTLTEHQEALWNAFDSAKSDVVVVSPTISNVAIEHDKLDTAIQSARERGVRVRIFTDSYLDASSGELKPSSVAGRKLLVECGAELHIARAIHNKALAVDDHTLIEGSFNWLAAVRSRGSVHQKFEVSSSYTGGGTGAMIRALIDELEHRVALNSGAGQTLGGKPGKI